MASSTENQFFVKNLVNINAHALFSVPMTFGLEVRSGSIFAPRIKCIGQIARAK